jgi:hypothetical protein
MRCEHTPLPRGLTTSILQPQSHLFHPVVSYQDDIYSLFRYSSYVTSIRTIIWRSMNHNGSGYLTGCTNSVYGPSVTHTTSSHPMSNLRILSLSSSGLVVFITVHQFMSQFLAAVGLNTREQFVDRHTPRTIYPTKMQNSS